MTRPERLEHLIALIREDPRVRGVTIVARPRQLAVYIGGFQGWKHVVRGSQIDDADLRACATAIVDRWEQRRV